MADYAFADLVGDEQVFFTEYFNKKPMLRKNAVPGDPRDILSLRKLDQLVNLEVIRPPYIKVNLKRSGGRPSTSTPKTSPLIVSASSPNWDSCRSLV